MHLHVDEPGFFCAGTALTIWVVYQSITGKIAYKGKAARREQNPRLFWLTMAFEGLFGASCLGSGLHLMPLAIVPFGLFTFMALGMVAWLIGRAVKRMLKYPWCIWRHFQAGRPQAAALELQSFLARHPADRETLFLLAGAYEEAGQREASLDLYTELSGMNDSWGRGAKEFLLLHQRKGRQAVAVGQHRPR